MGLTRLPNGVTACSTTALQYNSSATDGDLDCNNIYANGKVIGAEVVIQYTFGTASAAETAYLPVPFTGNIVSAYVTIGATSAVAAAYTVRIGSAGTVAVASVTNTITLNGAQESLATTSVSVTTASGITVVRGAQGTTGSTSIGVVFKRTA